jgi:hypothetical protein
MFKDIQKAFKEIANAEDIKPFVKEIALLVSENSLTNESIGIVLSQYNIRKIQDVKIELLDLLIKYANCILEDDIISNVEKRNFDFLKLYFRVKEGDFLKYKPLEIKEILQKQLEKLYADNYINMQEAEYNVLLQDIFDLSYAQFDAIKEKFVIRSIEQGADITDLDTANTKILKSGKNKIVSMSMLFFLSFLSLNAQSSYS